VLLPKLVTTLREGYTGRQLVADLTAGGIVAVVALPLAIAFAIASGVTPDRGLWTAIIAGFLVSALGGSRVQIGGPTGAFIVIVYGVVQQHGVDGLLLATLMAGGLLVAFGLVGLGAAIKFIPHPVVLGFTSGIALIIFSSQVKDLFGLPIETVPADFLEKWVVYAEHFRDVDPATALLGALSLAILVFWPRISRRVPGPFVVLLVTTTIVQLGNLPVETIGSRFGEISAAVPRPALPSVDLAMARDLVGPAFAIALLAAIESLLSAVVADGIIGGRHRSNMELVAQGVANIVSPLFGGIPATGAIARTATNIRNGGRTPIAGIAHAVVLLLITLFFGRWAALIPFAALGAILVVVAYNMSEWRTFRAEFRGAPRSDVLVLMTTFLLTVLVDLTIALQVGMVLAAFLFMRRMSEVTDVTVVRREFSEENGDEMTRIAIPPDTEIYEINGPFFFGAAEKFRSRVGTIATRPRVLIIRMRNVPVIDSTGMHALREFTRRSRSDGMLVLLAEVAPLPHATLSRAGLVDELGEANVHLTLEAALAHAAAPNPTRAPSLRT
jgi:sulfate permease, SulP family